MGFCREARHSAFFATKQKGPGQGPGRAVEYSKLLQLSESQLDHLFSIWASRDRVLYHYILQFG
jgi:hypothetical protein